MLRMLRNNENDTATNIHDVPKDVLGIILDHVSHEDWRSLMAFFLSCKFTYVQLFKASSFHSTIKVNLGSNIGVHNLASIHRVLMANYLVENNRQLIPAIPMIEALLDKHELVSSNACSISSENETLLNLMIIDLSVLTAERDQASDEFTKKNIWKYIVSIVGLGMGSIYLMGDKLSAENALILNFLMLNLPILSGLYLSSTLTDEKVELNKPDHEKIREITTALEEANTQKNNALSKGNININMDTITKIRLSIFQKVNTAIDKPASQEAIEIKKAAEQRCVIL